MNPSLAGYTAAVLESVPVDDTGRLAAELESVDELVERNTQLRSAITDTSVPPSSRRAVIADLLAGKVSEPARRTASLSPGSDIEPAIRRWVRPHLRRRADCRTW